MTLLGPTPYFPLPLLQQIGGSLILLHNIKDSSSASTSISVALNQVMQQVDYHCFADIHTRRTDPLYKELCLIIAEVFLLEPESVINVNGAPTPMRLVQDIYMHLRTDHIQIVFTNFQNVAFRIYNKKAYLRTALYNVVFEIESHYANEEFYGLTD
jgi:hypothetical protein